MKESRVEGGRFHKDQFMLYFGIALLLGGLAGKAAESLPIFQVIRNIVSTVDDSRGLTTEVGPRLSK